MSAFKMLYKDYDTYTDCIIEFKGERAEVSFEHPLYAKITDSCDCFAYLMNAVVCYRESNLEAQLMERYGEDLENISLADFRSGVAEWNRMRDSYNALVEVFGLEILDLLEEVTPCI